MGKKIFTLVLLVAIGGQTFSQGLFLLEYHVNKSFFIRNCENKLRPQMHCNGQCILMKKIGQEQKKNEQSPEPKLQNNAENLFCYYSFLTISPFIISHGKPVKTNNCSGNLPNYYYDIFHPPQV